MCVFCVEGVWFVRVRSNMCAVCKRLTSHKTKIIVFNDAHSNLTLKRMADQGRLQRAGQERLPRRRGGLLCFGFVVVVVAAVAGGDTIDRN